MQVVYTTGAAIGMHDRLKRRKDSNPGPSQRSDLRDSAAVDPNSLRAAVMKRSQSSLRIMKGFVPGRKAGPSSSPGTAVPNSETTASLAAAASRIVLTCFRAVRGSMQPRAAQAASVKSLWSSFPPSSSPTSVSPEYGLPEMRCSGSIRLVYGRPVPRVVRQIIVTTRRRSRFPS
jgi:hypothetical protein